tara:strand:- start:185 stop:286 length:102 start_codon:yes stop_codon:yes gene_type:complete
MVPTDVIIGTAGHIGAPMKYDVSILNVVCPENM